MSFKEFTPTYWNDKVFKQYRNSLVFGPLTTREYEGKIQESGDQVKINEIGKVTTKSYTGADIVYEVLADASKYLKITEADYTGVTLKDIDKAQNTPKLAGDIQEEMGVSMAESVDVFIATLAYDDAALVTGWGTEAVPVEIGSVNVTSLFSEMTVAMDDANVPKNGRVAVVPNWLAAKIGLTRVIYDTNNSKTLDAGYFGEFMGFSVYQSNNLVHSGTDWYAPVFFRDGDTIAFASQITEMEAMRAEKKFHDLLRALNTYGAKTVRPSSLFSVRVKPKAETVI